MRQNHGLQYWVCLGMMVSWGIGIFAADVPLDNSDCFLCHSDDELYRTNAVGEAIHLFVDEDQYAKSVHATNTCVSCHRDLTSEHPDNEVRAQKVDCAQCHEYQSKTYAGSAHALALQRGDDAAATCVDCHGKHDIPSSKLPDSPLYFTRLADACGECHPAIADEVQRSIHGKSSALGHREAATCLDCHSEHGIEDLRATSPWKIAEQVCSKCHASERINTKFKLPTDRVKTFEESYHGLASHYGSMRAANCASCHGAHLILPSFDPASSTHTNNLVATCGKCHPGASEKFAQGKIHISVDSSDDFGSRISFWVRRLYLYLIVGVIGLMLAHNFLFWRRRAMAAFYSPDRVVQRMDPSQRIQHLLLALSFIVLAISGFALKFPESWLTPLLGSDEAVRRIVHRVAGVVMLALGVYHVIYVAITAKGRQLVRDLMPQRKDFQDVATNIKYQIFHGHPRAKYGRFGYPEKAEYWAVVWGSIIMGVSGLMIWFKLDVTQMLPRWAVDVATTVHYYEAILACLAILVWHFYFVFFDPDVYPINWAWWDGRVSKKWHEHEHPLDHDAVHIQPGKKTGTESASHEPGLKK